MKFIFQISIIAKTIWDVCEYPANVRHITLMIASKSNFLFLTGLCLLWKIFHNIENTSSNDSEHFFIERPYKLLEIVETIENNLNANDRRKIVEEFTVTFSIFLSLLKNDKFTKKSSFENVFYTDKQFYSIMSNVFEKWLIEVRNMKMSSDTKWDHFEVPTI